MAAYLLFEVMVMLLSRLNDVVWSPWLLGLFLAAGLYYSLRTGFFQIFRIPLWLRTTLSLIHI